MSRFTRPQDTRLPSSQRGYDARWRKLRRMKLAANPLCEECERRRLVVRATMVHHIMPIKGPDDPGRLDWDNLMSLCEPCHDAKHSSSGENVGGCGMDGWPVHGGHPWNK